MRSKQWFKTKHVNGSSTDVIRLEEQRTAIAIANRCIKDNLTVRQLEQLVAELNAKHKAKRAKAKKPSKKNPFIFVKVKTA